MSAVKNVGEGPIENILKERAQNGAYNSFADFCSRVDLRTVNKRTIESLIKVGAMTSMGKRSQLLSVLDTIVTSAARAQKERAAGQTSLFDAAPDTGPKVFSGELTLPDIPEFPPKELLKMEKELIGVYMSDHPLNYAKQFIEKQADTNTDELKDKPPDEKVTLGGLFANKRKIITKSGKPMITGTFEDLNGQVPVVLFPGNYDRCAQYFIEEEIVILKGKVSFKQEEVQVIIDELIPYQASRSKTQALHISFKNIQDEIIMEKVKDTLANFAGTSPVYIHTDTKVIDTSKHFAVNLLSDLEMQLAEIIGAENVWQV
ncbi:MAG: OB-fold nucleic acid binding domain-containing protein [Candidatus Margulisiibacteriota bacterium]